MGTVGRFSTPVATGSRGEKVCGSCSGIRFGRNRQDRRGASWAVRLARANPSARILLTTYSEPLAELLQTKLKVLAPEAGAIIPRITVRDLPGTAEELFQLVRGRRPRIVSADALRSVIADAAEKVPYIHISSIFLIRFRIEIAF